MWVEGGNRGAELMDVTAGRVQCTLLFNFHHLQQLGNSNYCDFQHFSDLVRYSLHLLQLWIFYPVCSWLQIQHGSAGFIFERETCNSFMAARSEGTLRCVSRYPKGERCFLFSMKYFTLPFISNVVPISWSRWVKVQLKTHLASCWYLEPHLKVPSDLVVPWSSCRFIFWKRNLHFPYRHAVKNRLHERFTTVIK